jgi:hypothetical protein
MQSVRCQQSKQSKLRLLSAVNRNQATATSDQMAGVISCRGFSTIADGK